MVEAPRGSRKVIRDPVHGYIRVPEALYDVVQSLPVQRLRNISQNARTVSAYPSLNGSRFEHALGTMHLAIIAWEHAFANAWHESSPTEAQAAFLKCVRDDLYKIFCQNLESDKFLFNRYFHMSDKNKHHQKDISSLDRDLPELISDAVGIVGLLHDVGHPPFSHLLEDCYLEYASDICSDNTSENFALYAQGVDDKHHAQFHEFAGKVILNNLDQNGAFSKVSSTLVRRIYEARSGKDWAACLHGIIDGQIDVDRLDYIRRDAMRAGTEYHEIDFERLLQSIELHPLKPGEWTVGISVRGLSAVESLLLQRAQSYRWVIHNARSLVSDSCLKHAFSAALYDSSSTGTAKFSSPRPNLDYISSWSDSSTVARSYYVDDARVMTWLRDSRTNAEKSGSSAARDFTAYMAVADESSIRYRTAWRTQGEFLAAVDNAINSGTSKLAELMWVAHTRLGCATQRAPSETQTSEYSKEVTENFKKRLDNEPTFRALAFHSLVNQIIEQEQTKEIGQSIEDWLNNKARNIDDAEGVWVIRYIESLKAFSRDIALWDGSVEHRLEDLSPIPAALNASETLRPKLWAFYIPTGGMIPTREEVASALMENVVDLYTVSTKS